MNKRFQNDAKATLRLNSAINNIRHQGFKAWIYKLWTVILHKYFSFLYHKRNFRLKFLNNKCPVHYGVWGFRNAGDTVLYKEVENCFQKKVFRRRDITKGEIVKTEIDKINSRNSFLVLGGGGLFLKDSNPNQNSNWQFNISVENLSKINIPVVLFAIGYNRFRNQEDFDELFKKHLLNTIEKSVFVGLRNQGSINAIKAYLPDHLHEKLVFQPCPTTIIKYSNPKFYKEIDINNSKNKIIAINIAADRLNKRFDGREDAIISSIVKLAGDYRSKGWKVLFVGHTLQDKIIKSYINNDFKYVDLTFKSTKRICSFYSKVALTIGMRGHAQMIPFGLGNPIISLISHDKLKWFLDDIGHPEWGVEIKDEAMEANLQQKINMIIENYQDIRIQIKNAQENLKRITDKNIDDIYKKINKQ